ncbi:hypothetical protein BLNAU_8069 [Blattamonas nauphoetae]|uniref:Uncharacterized protein n=1 Tax=Blattamonas nauphoetae TaxID=2049346 RepID=A0ABQ9XZY2_9EUKA|nr:hypothetical protein BLNAU_8069 [Blattamonas nauphoetae]
MSISPLPFSMDCSPFLNWSGDELVSESEKAVVFRSLVATLKSQPALDASQEAKAVRFLESVKPSNESSANAFLNCLASSTDNSLTDFGQCIAVLISSASKAITTAALKLLSNQLLCCSAQNVLLLIKADLVHQLIMTLNPHSLSFADAVHIHTSLLSIITNSLWLTTPYYLSQLGIKDDTERQTVHETVLQQVLSPLEKYIWHLCMNRFSIVDGDMSNEFMTLLTRILRICPYYQPSMDIVVNMPIVLTIPSCLAFFENDASIYRFVYDIVLIQQDLNKKMGEVRQMWQKVHRMLRMEGIEDMIEKKHQNDKNTRFGRWIVHFSIKWNNLQDMNLPQQE